MKRIHKNLKKVLAMVLVCAMLVMSMGAYSGEVAYANDEFSFEGLVEVVVYETETTILIAYVDEMYVAEYTYRLENEVGYRDSQIEEILGLHNHDEDYSSMMRCPVPSSSCYLSSTTKLYESDILDMLDTMNVNMTEYEMIRNSTAFEFVEWLVGKTGVGTLASFLMVTLDITLIAAESILASWAEDSIFGLVNGDYSYICRCIYVNTGSTYPAAWVLTSRV
ncbi:MAG: hypothetical protein R3Y45_06555 [Bacillota bacterium]